eukprot:jgi/Bigna1/88346/estExt_fgenesh1_pg.C_310025
MAKDLVEQGLHEQARAPRLGFLSESLAASQCTNVAGCVWEGVSRRHKHGATVLLQLLRNMRPKNIIRISEIVDSFLSLYKAATEGGSKEATKKHRQAGYAAAVLFRKTLPYSECPNRRQAERPLSKYMGANQTSRLELKDRRVSKSEEKNNSFEKNSRRNRQKRAKKRKEEGSGSVSEINQSNGNFNDAASALKKLKQFHISESTIVGDSSNFSHLSSHQLSSHPSTPAAVENPPMRWKVATNKGHEQIMAVQVRPMLFKVPLHTQCMIASFLDDRSVGDLALSCKTLRKMCISCALWRRRCCQRQWRIRGARQLAMASLAREKKQWTTWRAARAAKMKVPWKDQYQRALAIEKCYVKRFEKLRKMNLTNVYIDRHFVETVPDQRWRGWERRCWSYIKQNENTGSCGLIIAKARGPRSTIIATFPIRKESQLHAFADPVAEIGKLNRNPPQANNLIGSEGHNRVFTIHNTTFKLLWSFSDDKTFCDWRDKIRAELHFLRHGTKYVPPAMFAWDDDVKYCSG